VPLHSRQSILHRMHSSPMKIVHDAVSKAQYFSLTFMRDCGLHYAIQNS
jgi:hypothetical protein